MEMRYCVIMCGGVGSRFWPSSREARPKQFLDFFGCGRSLLQLTVDRVQKVVPAERILLLTNKRYAPLIKEQLPEIPAANILLEPARRNTAPCICWAAKHIQALDAEGSMVVLPSDHLVLKESAFHEALERGFAFVEGGDRLLTLGIQPTSPHTGYGYIQQSDAVEGVEGIYRVKSFTEKPDSELAKVFLSSGEFFWNAGIFLWKVSSILKAFEKYSPETLSVFDRGDGKYGTPAETEFIEHEFPQAPSDSIDYAVMEKAANVYVETVDIGWSDLGSWNALFETSPRDADGNVTQNCRLLQQDCSGSVFAISDRDKIVVAKGLKDYIIADTGNALLIYPLADEQKIRQIVNDVKDRFGEDYV
ncbi:MAG: mannose-1-phosphate guanylyltransferase [Muribaculaceae bacterium]|nr:mannose-1-phosphate guanylyltransferase [Muribaculaceae bacterium]